MEEGARLSFNELSAMHDQLMQRRLSSPMDLKHYVDEWDQLLTFAGWTWDEYLIELDARWERSSKVPDVPQC